MTRYFLSDAHLFPEPEEHPGRDRLFSFFDHLCSSAEPGELWILGDLFDFWFEYSSVMPAGYGGCICRLRRLTRLGWRVHFLPGNHDCWAGGHFSGATGAMVHPDGPVELDAGGVRMLLAHGDGLGSGDIGYRLIRPLLRSRTAAALFRTIHPTPGTFLARKFSDTSKRILRRHMDFIPPGLEKWAEDRLEEGCDIVMTGHTHLDTVRKLEKGIYVSLGDWLTRFTYCRLEDGSAEPELLSYPPEASKGGNDERNS